MGYENVVRELRQRIASVSGVREWNQGVESESVFSESSECGQSVVRVFSVSGVRVWSQRTGSEIFIKSQILVPF